MVNQERLISDFMDLVRIDSPSRFERKMADAVISRLQELGLTVTEDRTGEQVGGNAGNVLAKLPGNTEAPALYLSAHLDTVQPGEGIEPVLQDGIISSAGPTILGGDDKAGVAAILEVLRVLREDHIPHGPLEICFSVGEEVGLDGAKWLDEKQFDAQIGFVFDTSGEIGTIVNAGPAQSTLSARIFGKAAHAGFNPEQGINAIQVAGYALAELKLGRIDYETTANIGKISGGRATNIVPDEVLMEGEARSHNPQKLQQQVQHMVDTIESVVQLHGGRVEMVVKDEYPAFALDATSPVVQLASRAMQAIGLVPVIQAGGGGSDANILNQKGIASVNISVGMSKVHSTDEFILVESLMKSAEAILSLIRIAVNNSIG